MANAHVEGGKSRTGTGARTKAGRVGTPYMDKGGNKHGQAKKMSPKQIVGRV